MNIQSLSIVVPSKKCINSCSFCVACMHGEEYKNQIKGNLRFRDLYEEDYAKRMEFARDNGCNTMMITGNSEPQQDLEFLGMIGTINNNLSKPFRWVEMQTTGVLIDDEKLRFFRNKVGISTISLSISSFDNDMNAKINGTREDIKVDIKHLCAEIKRYDFNLRISINLTDEFNKYTPEQIFLYCAKELNADQVTLRVLYSDNSGTPQAKWVEEHSANKSLIINLQTYIIHAGKPLEKLEFGRTKISLHGMSVVLDDDCMSKEAKEALKYVILRPNCKLYSKWDDPASLIF